MMPINAAKLQGVVRGNKAIALLIMSIKDAKVDVLLLVLFCLDFILVIPLKFCINE